MFNGMMDPELMRLAQEQISRMSPADLARMQQQVMSNPDLMKMASEGMKNMRPEDFKQAAEQLKHTRAEDLAEIHEKMANASPDELAAMRARFDAQVKYEVNAAKLLKKQGNDLHSQGRYEDASQKYLLVKKNLKQAISSEGRMLSLACSLNLMSCYLKMKDYDECIKEGSEVLMTDAKNVKALYRRGQAYKELGRFEEAVSDLSKALENSPDDETIADVLRDAKEKLSQEGGHNATRAGGVIIEEIIEEDEILPSEKLESSSTKHSAAQPEQPTAVSERTYEPGNRNLPVNSECLQALKEDPETLRSFQNFVSNADPETLAAVTGGKMGDVSPEMFKTAADMIGKMSPEELQKMVEMASSFQGGNPFNAGSSSDGSSNDFRPIPPNLTPDMLKTVPDIMSKMPAEELQKMFEMASSMRGSASVPTAVPLSTGRSSSDSRSQQRASKKNFSGARNEMGEASSSNVFPSTRSTSQAGFPSSSADLQEQMRNQMKDPAMRQMFTSMMKNMNPDMMASMGEQFGLKLSPEDAAKAQQAMASLSPEDLDRMMRWADRIQKGAEGAKKAKNWLLGRHGLIFAICMLILAMILHWVGFIGR